MNGHIKLARRLADHPIWTRRPFSDGQAWVDLILMAAWRDHGEGAYAQKRGTIRTSQLALEKRWGWDYDSVKRFLLRLQNDGMITFHTNRSRRAGGTMVTICNYDEFQSEKSPASTGMKTGKNAGTNPIGSASETTGTNTASNTASIREQNSKNAGTDAGGNTGTNPIGKTVKNAGTEAGVTTVSSSEKCGTYEEVHTSKHTAGTAPQLQDKHKYNPIAIWCEEFKKRYHSIYDPDGKAVGFLNTLGARADGPTFRRICKHFLNITEVFYVSRGHAVWDFYSNWNRWKAEENRNTALAAEGIEQQDFGDQGHGFDAQQDADFAAAVADMPQDEPAAIRTGSRAAS